MLFNSSFADIEASFVDIQASFADIQGSFAEIEGCLPDLPVAARLPQFVQARATNDEGWVELEPVGAERRVLVCGVHMNTMINVYIFMHVRMYIRQYMCIYFCVCANLAKAPFL